MAAKCGFIKLDSFGAVILICIIKLFDKGQASCTFETNLQGTWSSNGFGTITVTSNQLTLGKHSFLINGQKTNTVWDCLNDVTSPYIILRSELFQFMNENYYAYICMVLTQVNTNSYYFYMNSDTLSFFSNERILLYSTAATPGVLSTAMCTTTPSTAEFISMIRQGSESSAIVDCPEPLHSNFTYTLSTSGANLCPSETFVSICPGRQEVEFDYTKCSTPVAYSAGGRLGCVATIDDGSGTIYASLYNFDDSVNNLNTFQFSCAAVEDTLAETVQMSYSNDRCQASQSFSTTPTNGGLLTLTQNGTCEITTTTVTTEEATTEATTEEATTATTTTTESPIPILKTDTVNVAAIIGGILAAMLFIILLLLLVIYCIHRKKVIAKQRAIIDRRIKLFKIKQAQGLDDDENVLTEPSLDPDFPSYFESPKQELLSPVKKYIDTTSQTEIYQEKKKIVPEPIPEIGPTPKYLPWPWRTAKRASQKTTFQSQTDLRKFGPLPENTLECVNLADYTVNKYGLRYDDTGVDESRNSISRPPTRFIPRSKSVVDLTNRESKSGLSRSSSVASLSRSRTVLDAQTPTPRIINLMKSPSIRSLKLTDRSQTNILMPVKEREKMVVEPIERPTIMTKELDNRPLPHYMYPIRTKSVVSKFDTDKFVNPLAKPLRKEYTLLRPLHTKNKLTKSMNDKAKKKKKVLKKKISPYVVIPTPIRQITLLPLNLKKWKDNKVRQDPKKKKQSSKKTAETDFTALSQISKSVNTMESNFSLSPETLISNDMKPEIKSENTIVYNQLTNKEQVNSIENHAIKDGVERIKADKSEFQDSGISADESFVGNSDSPENGVHNSDLSSNDSKHSDSLLEGNTDGQTQHQISEESGTFKLPRLNLDTKTDERLHNCPLKDNLKLPQIQGYKKATAKPWK